MRELLTALINPFSIFWIIVIAAIILYLLKFRKIVFSLILIAALWMIIISTKPLPEFLVSHLEDQYPTLIRPDSSLMNSNVNIMILGGGYSDDKSLPSNDQLFNSSLARLNEGIRLYRILPDSKLITAGYNKKQKQTQAEVISNHAITLGVNPDDLRLISMIRNNTYGEAKAYSQSSELIKCNSQILVTDAIHMPRAMMIFRNLGMEPIPAPTNHIIKHNSFKSSFSWLPSISNIGMMDAAMHEYLGILWFKMGGE